MIGTLVLYYLPSLRLYFQGDFLLGVPECAGYCVAFPSVAVSSMGVRDSCLEGCDFWLLRCVQLVSYFGFSDLPLSVVPGNLLPRGPRQLVVTVESFPVCVHRLYGARRAINETSHFNWLCQILVWCSEGDNISLVSR